MPQAHYNPCFSEKWIYYLSPYEWRNRVHAEFLEVPLQQVEHAGCITDPDVIEGWLETLRAGRPIPPPVVVSTGNGTFYTHDGNHRLLALQEFLGPESTITVARAVPIAGFAFERVEKGDYYTYELQKKGLAPKLAKYIVPPAVACASVIVTYALRDPGAAPLLALFCISVVLTALYWGMRGAALLTLITLGVAAYLTEPVNSLLVTNLSHLVEIVLTGLGMLWVSYLISKGNWRLQ
jgi:hypothetical protein